jgi:hypothetical protein
MPRIDVAGDICLRKERSAQSCRADDDDSVDKLILGKRITNLT